MPDASSACEMLRIPSEFPFGDSTHPIGAFFSGTPGKQRRLVSPWNLMYYDVLLLYYEQTCKLWPSVLSGAHARRRIFCGGVLPGPL